MTKKQMINIVKKYENLLGRKINYYRIGRSKLKKLLSEIQTKF